MATRGEADKTPGTGTVSGSAGLDLERRDYITRLNALLQTDDSKIALIKDLIQETEQQREKVSRLELELEDERDSKDKWRGRFLESSREAEKAGHHPYVALLIDGDGMIFTENYLLHPQAGQTAAAALLQHTRELINSSGLCTPLLDTFEIVIRVFGNVNGLVETIQSRGLQTDFRNFVVGFSQSKALVDFVDVGWGKEMADSKIFGELRFHLSNYNCKHVILGASHDNGYARILGSLVVEGVDYNRIMLLEGVPFGREFKTLPFKRIKYPNMFLSQKVENWIPDSVQHTTNRRQHFQHTHSQLRSQDSRARSGTRQGQRMEEPQGINTAPPPPYQPSLLAPAISRPTIYPPPLSRPSVALLQRVGGIKPPPCFAHYLSGLHGGGPGCLAQGKCAHTHNAILTPEELQALGFLAQGYRCHHGLSCNKPSCFYGHQCQVVGVCTGKCVFQPEEHAPGTYNPIINTTTSDPQMGSSCAPKSTTEPHLGDAPKAEEMEGPQKLSKGQKKRLKKREKVASMETGMTEGVRSN